TIAIFHIGSVPIMYFSTGFLFFVIFMLWSSATILFCMFLSTIFNRPILAVVITVIIWMTTMTIPIILHPMVKVVSGNSDNSWRLFTCLFPNAALSWLMLVAANAETYAVGATW